MPTSDPDKQYRDLESEETPGELPPELLLPEVDKPRKEIRKAAGEVIFEHPDFDETGRHKALETLNNGIVRALEEDDLETAGKLKKERLVLETSVSKNSREAQANALKNYKAVSDAATVEDRNKLSASRRERIEAYAPVVNKWLKESADAIGKGTVSLVEGGGKALLYGTKKLTKATRFVLSNLAGLGADIYKEVTGALHTAEADRREKLGDDLN